MLRVSIYINTFRLSVFCLTMFRRCFSVVPISDPAQPARCCDGEGLSDLCRPEHPWAQRVCEGVLDRHRMENHDRDQHEDERGQAWAAAPYNARRRRL